MCAVAVREIRYRDAQAEAIRLEMRRDPNIIIMGEDIAGGAGRAHLGIVEAWGGAFKTTKGLITEFGPERVRDTPISEAGYIGMGVGAAMVGLRPVVELMFMDLVGVCMDQIMNNAAKTLYMSGGKIKVPITIVTHFGSGVRAGSQHSQSFYSIFAHVPGLKVVTPSDPYTVKGLLAAAIRDDDPVVVCSNQMLLGDIGNVPEEPYTLPIGKARIVQEGKDLTLVGIATTTSLCMEAAKALNKNRISVEVIDLLSLSPLDESLILESVKKTGRIVVVDEDTPKCSVASDIVAIVARKAFDYLDSPPEIVASPHVPVPFSGILEDAYGPSCDQVVKLAQSMFKS